MTDVKFFSSKMAGAPVLSGTKGSMIDMLDACLVTGFGQQTATSVTVSGGVATVELSATNFLQHQIVLVAGATPQELNGEHRVLALTTASAFTFAAPGVPDGVATGTVTVKTPPLGWLKPFTGTNMAAFKIDPVAHPDSTGILLKVTETTSYNANVCGYESMADIDTGSGQFPTSAQVSPFLGMFRSTGTLGTDTRVWHLVGDKRLIYVGVAHQPSSPFCWSAFGEFKSYKSADPYRYIVAAQIAGDSPPAALPQYNVTGTSNTSCQYVARSYTGLGIGVRVMTGSLFVAPGANFMSGSVGHGLLPYPNSTDYGVSLVKGYLLESGSYGTTALRGEWPGMYLILNRVGVGITGAMTGTYYDTEVPGFESKVVGFISVAESVSAFGVVAFDLTGPWEH